MRHERKHFDLFKYSESISELAITENKAFEDDEWNSYFYDSISINRYFINKGSKDFVINAQVYFAVDGVHAIFTSDRKVDETFN